MDYPRRLLGALNLLCLNYCQVVLHESKLSLSLSLSGVNVTMSRGILQRVWYLISPGEIIFHVSLSARCSLTHGKWWWPSPRVMALSIAVDEQRFRNRPAPIEMWTTFKFLGSSKCANGRDKRACLRALTSRKHEPIQIRQSSKITSLFTYQNSNTSTLLFFFPVLLQNWLGRSWVATWVELLEQGKSHSLLAPLDLLGVKFDN